MSSNAFEIKSSQKKTWDILLADLIGSANGMIIGTGIFMLIFERLYIGVGAYFEEKRMKKYNMQGEGKGFVMTLRELFGFTSEDNLDEEAKAPSPMQTDQVEQIEEDKNPH
jgi:hypothetical protein